MRRFALIAVPYLWLLALFLVPFVIVLKISLSDSALAIPPYLPTLDLKAGWSGITEFFSQLDFENFVWLTEDDLYWKAYLSSLKNRACVYGSDSGRRVSNCIRHGARAATLARNLVAVGDPAVLDQLSNSRLLLDGYSQPRRLSQPVFDGHRAD
jgi:hypothetical protein